MNISSRAVDPNGSSFLKKVAIVVSLMSFEPAVAQLCSQDPECSKSLVTSATPAANSASPVAPMFYPLQPMPNSATEVLNPNDSYIPTQIIASQAYQYFGNEYIKSVVENLFVLPAWSYEPDQAMTPAAREAFKRHSMEAYTSPSAYVISRKLIRDATGTYMNQTLYNWLVMSRRFYGEDLTDLPNHPEVTKSYRYIKKIVDQQKMQMMDDAEWANQIKWFNDDIQSAIDTCGNYKNEVEYIHEKLNKLKKLRDEPFSDFNVKNHPDLMSVMYPNGYNPYIVYPGHVSIFHTRIKNKIEEAAEASSMRRFILSNSVFGSIYDADTSLRDFVGDFDPSRCAYGIHLNQIDQDIHYRTIFESVSELEETYKDTLEDLAENLDNDDLEEVLIKYLQENPTSIQLALLREPDPRAVYLLSGILIAKERRDFIKQVRNVGIGVVTLPLVWVKGLMAARILFMVSTYYAVSTVRDLRTSYQMEDRIQHALAAGQIPKQRGMMLVETIKSQRPYSYINLALAGLSVYASAARVKQLGDMQAYVNATTQGGVQAGSKVEKLMVTKLSEPGANPIHHPVYSTTAADIGEDLTKAALSNALGGTQVTNEMRAALATGASVRPPIPRLPSSSSIEGAFDRVRSSGGAPTRSVSTAEKPAFVTTTLAQQNPVRLIDIAGLEPKAATVLPTRALSQNPVIVSKVAMREEVKPMKLIQVSLPIAEMVLEPIRIPERIAAEKSIEEQWKEMDLEPYQSTWHLLQEALNGRITLQHVRALLAAKHQCNSGTSNLSEELCAAVDFQLSSKRSNRIVYPARGYSELKGFDVDPKGFMKWWRNLNYIKAHGVVVKNPFTDVEISQINMAFDADVVASVEKGDPIAKGSIAHMEEHMQHVELYSEEIASMGIDLKYYRLLVQLHDAGKFMPSARVLEHANGNFLLGRIMWHDQSTADYLLNLGERLGIDASKMEHLIADIVGHNDGSGLQGIFWTTFFPHYGMPRRLEGDVMTIFDRFGQGNWIGAKKIVPQSVKEGFYGKVNDAYYISPNNTINQIDAIYKRALSRLKQRHVTDDVLGNLKAMRDYSVAAQRQTMNGYERLIWSQDKVSCSITANGETLVANNLEEFLADPFQKALQNNPN